VRSVTSIDPDRSSLRLNYLTAHRTFWKIEAPAVQIGWFPLESMNRVPTSGCWWNVQWCNGTGVSNTNQSAHSADSPCRTLLKGLPSGGIRSSANDVWSKLPDRPQKGQVNIQVTKAPGFLLFRSRQVGAIFHRSIRVPPAPTRYFKFTRPQTSGPNRSLWISITISPFTIPFIGLKGWQIQINLIDWN
jgi:hypothetical protein